MANELRIKNGLYLDNFTNNTIYPNILTYDTSTGIIGYMLTSSLSASNASLSITSSYPITITGSTIYSTGPISNTKWNSINTVGSIFLGFNAGATALNASRSIFLGENAGFSASNAPYSFHLGYNAGYQVSGSAEYSHFIGTAAGYQAYNASFTVFIGGAAGQYAEKGAYSTFIGYSAGFSATTASNAVFIGTSAGQYAAKASQSVFIGNGAGSSFDNTAVNSPGAYNIAIGSNVSLAPNQSRAINIGGIIFATGSYSGLAISTGSVGASGRVGIGIAIPTSTLHVSGTVTITGDSSSFVAPAPANVFSTNNSAVQTTANAWRGAAAILTPRKSGKMVVMCSGVHSGTSTANFTLYYSQSTSAPPAGRLVSTTPTPAGQTVGQSIQLENNPTFGSKAPFAISGMFDATIGLPYFVDMVQGGSSVTSSAFNLTVFEL